MGNSCCCMKDESITKLDEQIESLIHSKKTQNMTVSDCSFCKKKNVVCFKNYGSLRGKMIYVCVCCE